MFICSAIVSFDPIYQNLAEVVLGVQQNFRPDLVLYVAAVDHYQDVMLVYWCFTVYDVFLFTQDRSRSGAWGA